MTQLTIIIPFLNEGNEVENTVLSIRETAVTNPIVLLINDGSDDNIDYESVATRHNCSYIRNEKRTGSAPSRDIGVAASETPYIMFLDGHMRFYEKGWDEKLLKLLAENPRSLLCSQTKRLMRNDDGEVVTQEKSRVAYGSYIDLSVEERLVLKWNYVNVAPHTNLMEIPCVLGAAYACNKDYWVYLSGMKGLLSYGLEEQLISIKTWLEGGQCLLVKDWVVGHLYRKSFPYEAPSTEMFYNRLFLLELFFPYSIKKKYFAGYQNGNTTEFSKVYTLLKNNYKEIKIQKDYLKNISHHKMDYFLEMNEKIKMLN